MRTLRDRAISYRQRDYQAPDKWLKSTLAGDRRWVGRVACRTPAAFRERQRSRFGVEIVNLSTHGCGVMSAAPPLSGAYGWIIMPTLESWYANVAWRNGSLFGLDFSEPLHRAVAEMILHRSIFVPPQARQRSSRSA
ncbi:MAG: hypothetical protein ACT4N8_12260 [Sphingosinicella sp.]|uniref:hypothetical protein n=1 Tax=Sphingosinicella sp. TaxID=1917971 RepID=UPI0040377088